MTQSNLVTYFAPPEKASAEDLLAAARSVGRRRIVRDLLDAVPGPAIILNVQRQIIAANRNFLSTMQVEKFDDVLGLRPGEALKCRQAACAPAGCGTAEACRYCWFIVTLLEALAQRDRVAGECRLLTATGTAIDLAMSATFHVLDGAPYLFVGLRDVSAEKRREVLERTFFHDVLNTAGGIQGLLKLMTIDRAMPPDDSSLRRVLKLSCALIDEIHSQQQLLAAERNEITVEPTQFALDELLYDLVEFYKEQPAGRNKEMILGRKTQAIIQTDRTLLSRVVGNLIKNALEASEPGGRITIVARLAGSDAVVRVGNDAVFDESTRAQLFQRSFSTKGRGRGVGLYSVQLFAERFLGGKVSFTSAEGEGTMFEVRIPIV